MRVGALLHAASALATLVVAVGLIGLDVLSDRTLFLQMAVENPRPILLQDALKVPLAAAMGLLVTAFHRRLRAERSSHMRLATGAGTLAILLLLSNALLSVYGVTHASRMSAAAGARLNAAVGTLAILALVCSGIWYVLSNATARRAAVLPRGVCSLGIAVGALHLLPPVALLGLVLSIVWSLALLRTPSSLESAAADTRIASGERAAGS